MSGIRRCEWGLIMTTVFYLAAGVGEASLTLYLNVGENVTLPCANVLPKHPDCSSTTWIYNKNNNETIEEVTHGKVKKVKSARADRLSVGSNCSLFIHDVRAEDVGLYTCQQYPPEGGNRIVEDAQVYLSLLTLSSSTPVLNLGTSVTLTCYLSTYDGPSVCVHSLIWLDEAGSELQTDSMVQGTQSPCDITLTVTLHEPATSRRIRCRLTNSTKHTLKETLFDLPSNVSDQITTTIQSQTTDKRPASSSSTSVSSFASTPTRPPQTKDFPLLKVARALGAAAIGLVTVIIIIIACKKRTRKSRNSPSDDMIGMNTVSAANPTANPSDPPTRENNKDQPEDGITYASINHSNTTKTTQNANIQDTDAVTYASIAASSVKGPVHDNASSDVSNLYATVSKPHMAKRT